MQFWIEFDSGSTTQLRQHANIPITTKSTPTQNRSLRAWDSGEWDRAGRRTGLTTGESLQQHGAHSGGWHGATWYQRRIITEVNGAGTYPESCSRENRERTSKDEILGYLVRIGSMVQSDLWIVPNAIALAYSHGVLLSRQDHEHSEDGCTSFLIV